jgi:hypothetical protein
MKHLLFDLYVPCISTAYVCFGSNFEFYTQKRIAHQKSFILVTPYELVLIDYFIRGVLIICHISEI